MSQKKEDPTRTSLEMPALEAPELSEASLSSVTGFLPDKELIHAMSKLSALESLLSLCARDLKFSDFIREVLVTIMRVVKSEAGSVLEYDHKREVFFFRAVTGAVSDQVDKFIVPKGQGIVGHVAESKQTLLVNNLEENRVHLKVIGKAVGFEARNMVAVPVLVRGKIYGVLELINRIGDENFTAEDIETLGYLVNVAAKAIEVRLTLGWALARVKKDAA